MVIPRRTFLLQTGTAIAGLSALGCDDVKSTPGSGQAAAPPSPPPPPPPPSKKPKALIDALDRMRLENKPGVAVRIPEEPRQRHIPGHLLLNWLNQEEDAVRHLFSEIVFVCLEGPVIDTFLAPAGKGDNLVLFNSEGRSENSLPFPYHNSHQALISVLEVLVHDSDESRLRERAAGLRAKTAPAVLDALDHLAETGRNLEADRATLLEAAPRIVPLLIQEYRRLSTPARKDAFRDLLSAYYKSSNPALFGPSLPYGVQAGPYAGGCGNDPCLEQPPPSEDDRRVIVACGMGRVPPAARSFVRYLTQ